MSDLSRLEIALIIARNDARQINAAEGGYEKHNFSGRQNAGFGDLIELGRTRNIALLLHNLPR